MEKETGDVSDGLEKIKNTIARYAPQGSLSYRSYEAKVENLYSSAIGITLVEHA